jgi:hypothetical protein
MNRRAVVTVLVCAALLAGAVLGVAKSRRAGEWAHGGDTLDTTVEFRMTDESGVAATVARLGGPDAFQAVLHDDQGVAVRVQWTGPRHPGSWYQLVALDGRDIPAAPLRPVGGWNVNGDAGSNWASKYEALAEHYPWLAGLAQLSGTYAVDAPADRAGSLTALFQPRPGLPMRNSNDVVVVVFLVDDDGEVRWAKRL